jgi:predicted DNA-binding transcriptional regulator AlpA
VVSILDILKSEVETKTDQGESMSDRLLTIKDLVTRTGFSRSYFHNRDKTGAATLKLVFTRPLKTTEEFYETWLKSLADGQVVAKAAKPGTAAAMIERMRADMMSLKDIIGFNNNMAMINDALDYLTEIAGQGQY